MNHDYREMETMHTGAVATRTMAGAQEGEKVDLLISTRCVPVCVCVCTRSYVVRTSVEKSGEQIQVFPAASGLRTHTMAFVLFRFIGDATRCSKDEIRDAWN